jgi:CheY-like chemotaxis protein
MFWRVQRVLCASESATDTELALLGFPKRMSQRQIVFWVARGRMRVMSFASVKGTPAVARRRVLLVEDHLDSRVALARILGIGGFDVECAATVREGIAALDHRPNILLLDLQLSDGAGVAVLEEGRRRNSVLRVGVITGSDDPAIAPKADRIFIKPIAVDALLAWLGNG